MVKAIDQLQEMGVVTDKEGSLIADLTAYKLESTVVRKKGALDLCAVRVDGKD